MQQSNFKPIQSDLLILFDVGWDLPFGVDIDQERWRLGSMELDPARFPSCTGSPAERIAKLNRLVQSAGWRGAGLWVGAQMTGDGKDGLMLPDTLLEPYYRTRARWSVQAGIPFWKVDVGARTKSPTFRHLLTRIAREEAPELLLEHSANTGPLNDVAVPWEKSETVGSGRFRDWQPIYQRSLEVLPFSDIFRSYDVTGQLSVATTLDRVAELLKAGSEMQASEYDANNLLNCEDEPYLGAALGCAIGIMRHPLFLERPGEDYDPARLAQKIDAVMRAVRWQRIAPAFDVKAVPVTLDEALLTDDWTFQKSETWADFVWGKTIVQSAPARVSRGMLLVKVSAENEAPFVVAARHPNGATAIATLPRTLHQRGIFMPLADVALPLTDETQPLAIFGQFRSLRIKFAQPLGLRRIWAQDLAGDTAEDITSLVRVEENDLVLSGELIDRVGLSAASSGDRSDPGLVIKIVGTIL